MSGIEGQTGLAVEKASPLERIYEKVSAHNTRIDEMISSLTNTMDRMVGAVPSSVPETPTEAVSSTSISKINDTLSQQGTLLTQLMEQVTRVTEL